MFYQAYKAAYDNKDNNKNSPDFQIVLTWVLFTSHYTFGFSTTSLLLMFSCVVVNLFFSSEEKMFIILDGSFDNNSNALFGSAFRKIIFDP
jgi:hypothetical protein